MIPRLWKRKRRDDKRNGLKRFLRRNTNGNAGTRIESSCRTSVDPFPYRSMSVNGVYNTYDCRATVRVT